MCKFGAIAVFVIAAVAAFNVSLNMNENEMSLLSLANVEALAQDTELGEVTIECGRYSGTCCKYDISSGHCIACGDPRYSC